MRLEHRRGQRATGVRAALQRIRWWARDLADGLRLLVTQPVAATGLIACQTMWMVVSVAGRVLRGGCQQFAYLALPIVMLGVPWIDFSIHLDGVARAAERDIAPAARRYVDEVAELSMADLPVCTLQMRARYTEHRQRLIVPIADLDIELTRDLHALSSAVAGGLDKRTIDYRLDRLLVPYARRKLLLFEQVFVHPADTPHGPYEPSDNFLDSNHDEQALFAAARARSARPEAQRYLDEILAAVAAQWSYESCPRLYDLEQLLQRPQPFTIPVAASLRQARGLGRENPCPLQLPARRGGDARPRTDAKRSWHRRPRAHPRGGDRGLRALVSG